MRFAIFFLVAAAVSLLSTSADAVKLITSKNTCVQIGVAYPLHTAVPSETHLTTETCDSSNMVQRWSSVAIGDDLSILAGVQSNGVQLCIDVPDAKAGDGKPVQVYGCNQTQAQVWRTIIDLETGTVGFASSLTDTNKWCLSADGSGGSMVLRACNTASSAQKFTLN